MNNRNAILAVAVVVIAIGGIVVLTVRQIEGQAPVHAPAVANGDAGARVAGVEPVPADRPDGSAGRAPEPPPPWLQPDAGDPTEPAAADGDPVRTQQLHRLDASVRSMVAAGTAGTAERNQHLHEALDVLEEMDDPAVKAQLDLDAVRANFELSVRIQALAAQLQQIAAEPRSPDRSARIQAKVAEIRDLHAQVDPDVRAAGSTLPPIGSRQAPAR